MHGANYRDGNGQPFTRKEYIKGKPQIKIAKFQGGKRSTYQYCVQLCINEKIQIRHMAIESTRLAANKTLEKTTGESGYYSRLRIYPHNLLRENKMYEDVDISDTLASKIGPSNAFDLWMDNPGKYLARLPSK